MWLSATASQALSFGRPSWPMSEHTDLRSRQAAVVLVGHFNPLIFQPEWLAAHELIGPREAEAARGGEFVLHPQMALINLASARIQVTAERFDFLALEAPLITAKDFAVKCFRLLSHTPVTQMGINFITVFRARRREDWDAFGDALAPKAPWEALLGAQEGKRSGGLVSMTMERSSRADGLPGSRSVSIQAMERDAMETGITFNDHFTFDGDTRASTAADLLEERWDAAEREALQITAQLRDLCHGL